MDFLHENLEFEVKLLNTCKISTRQLELLYKYALKRMFIKSEPVYWWLLQESWSVGPCAVLLLHSSNCEKGSLTESLLELKGSYFEQGKKTVRALFDSFSMIMNIIHSSDDSYCMIREASIFLNEADIRNVLEHPESSSIDEEVLKSQFILTNEHSTANDITSAVMGRTYATIAMSLKHSLDKTIEMVNLLISSNTYLEFVNKVSESYPNSLQLFIIAYALSGKADVPISAVEGLFDTKDIYITHWEKVVIKNTLLQRIWSNQYN